MCTVCWLVIHGVLVRMWWWCVWEWRCSVEDIVTLWECIEHGCVTLCVRRIWSTDSPASRAALCTTPGWVCLPSRPVAVHSECILCTRLASCLTVSLQLLLAALHCAHYTMQCSTACSNCMLNPLSGQSKKSEETDPYQFQGPWEIQLISPGALLMSIGPRISQ